MADNSKTLQLTLQVKDDGSVVVDTVTGKIDQLNQKTTSGGKSITDVLGGVKAGWFAVAGGVTAAVAVIDKFLDAASEAEQIESRLAFQASAVGYNFQEVKAYVDEFANSVQNATRFSDEMARQGLTAMLQYTSDLNEAMQGARLAMDMTTQTGMGFETTSRYMGMAMAGNVEMLGRWIPELRDLDSKLGSTATSAEKSAYAMKILNEKFGGASQADIKSYAGKIKSLKNEFDDLKESIGKALLPLAKTAVSGAKALVKAPSNLISLFEGPNEMMADWNKQIEAARKANEQAKINAAAKAYDEDLKNWKATQEQRQMMNFQFAMQEWTLKKDTMALIDAEEYQALEKAKKIGADLNQIRQVYHLKRLEQIKKEKEEEQNAMLSLATMWKGYYDERIAKENEIIGLIKGEGIETTIGAKFEFAGVEEQFRKISEQAGMFTPEEFEKIKAAYLEKLKKILPWQGGEWEEFTVPTGREMGPGGPRTTYGTDWRWRESAMTEEQRRIEQMREESMRRIETMGAGVTSGKPLDIIGQFDESRNRVIALQQEIAKIQEIKLEVESSKLIDVIDRVADFSNMLNELSSRRWPINLDINTGTIVIDIERELVSRLSNKRSALGPFIER
jgi:hypothetical protein